MNGVPEFDPDAGEPDYVYAKVADHIAARIEVGELVSGQRLPGERELAQDYRIALGTARRALVELRERGLVVTLHAKGTFVSKSSTDS
ncbi:winged helix-turn-helix domain-containing protein [Salinifilum ghardaiensis]